VTIGISKFKQVEQCYYLNSINKFSQKLKHTFEYKISTY